MTPATTPAATLAAADAVIIEAEIDERLARRRAWEVSKMTNFNMTDDEVQCYVERWQQEDADRELAKQECETCEDGYEQGWLSYLRQYLDDLIEAEEREEGYDPRPYFSSEVGEYCD